MSTTEAAAKTTMNTIHIILGFDSDIMRAYARKLDTTLGNCPYRSMFPESEVHPREHGPMAEKYAAMAHSSIVVTHSEVFVLRLRRMVAERRLKPEQLKITWLGDGSAAPMNIVVEEDGEVTAWPEGIFSEAFDEVCAIRRAQGPVERKSFDA
jgi:hypothetical protein